MADKKKKTGDDSENAVCGAGPGRRMRELAIALLDDDRGIGEAAYRILAKALKETGNGDLPGHVEAADGRFYLPEDFADGSGGRATE